MTEPTAPPTVNCTITVIVTVYNEGEHIQRLMHSLMSQTRQPNAVIVVDGGSQDDTVEILRQYTNRLPLRIEVLPRANISEGRNRAVELAQDGIIAVTDAGVELAPDWLEKLTDLLLEDSTVDGVGGFFVADSQNVFEIAMGATVLPLVEEIDARTFLPSSRSVAFRKSLWERSGGYPVWLDYCEDLVFDLRVRQLTQQFAFAPAAVVRFRPRGSLRTFYRQYYLYARGDGKADLWRRRHAVRYVTYFIAAPLLCWLGWRRRRAFWLLGLLGAAAYLRRPYQRLVRLMREFPQAMIGDWLKAIVLVPIIRVVGDLAKMHGYPIGWLWRLRHHPPDWREVLTASDPGAAVANTLDSQ